MPVYQLNDSKVFPDPTLSEPDGLLAIGGDLSSERLILAYSMGIFPWYSEGQPILWWSPNPRMVLLPEKFIRHKNLLKTAYIELHKIGIAHSVEVSCQNGLVGGLYGLSIGKCFFGESMFHTVTDASKVALWHLVNRLLIWEFDMIDVQQETNHLKNLGVVGMDRKEFLHLLNNSIAKKSIIGSWDLGK